MPKEKVFSDEENSKLTFYSRLLSQTDTATQSFLESLSKIDKKITVVFYGDHLPGLYPESAFKNNPESQYQTDYFIWSNFDAPKLNYPWLIQVISLLWFLNRPIQKFRLTMLC